jgi:STE24 endopeptidase
VNIYRRVKADPADWFSADEVSKAKDYQRPLTAVRIAKSVVGLVVLLVIISTGAAPAVANRFAGGAQGNWIVRLLVVLAFLLVVDSVSDIPWDLWTEFVHERKWEFSTQTVAGFVSDLVKGLVMSYVLFAVLMLALWALIRTTNLWWVYGWGVFLLFTVVLAFLGPVVLMPLFNKFTPLENETLTERLRALAREAGLNISEVQVMDASKRTRKDNAFFTGLGRTRRVVLFDNILVQPESSIATVVAHELGHWRKRHIFRSLIVGTVLTFILFYVLHVVMSWGALLRWAHVSTVKDPASLPLFLLVLVGGQLVLQYGLAWLSRALEREADLEALKLTQDADSFTTMMRGLSTKNLSDLAPSSLTYLRLDHPPAAERLEFAKQWATAEASKTS